MLDTAGLREAGGRIEALGIDRARRRAEAADLRVFLVDRADEVAGLGVAAEPEDIVALAKADLRAADAALAVSGLTGAGIEALLGAGVGDPRGSGGRRWAGRRMPGSARRWSGRRRRSPRATAELAGAAPRPEIAAAEICGRRSARLIS